MTKSAMQTDNIIVEKNLVVRINVIYIYYRY